MYFRSPPEVDRAREAFRNIDLSKENGDRFFSEVGPGNVILGGKHMPFERFCDYQELLRIFREDDPDKYRVIHKGTPFLFLAWTAHDMRNFESALFYLDAAIAEDIRDLKKRSGNSAGWMNLPACLVLTLNGAGSLSSLRNLLEVQINRFNRASGHTISVERFVRDFVVRLVASETKTTSIVTAFYTFVLEFEERVQELHLRSSDGGSIEPFVGHLFKGGLIFESLLKHFYPKEDNDKPAKTLNKIFDTVGFKGDFGAKVDTSASTLQDVLSAIKGSDLQTAFDTTAKLRNTTGHNLVWDDIFTEDVYRVLFEQEVNAILYVIARKFLAATAQ